LLNEGKSYEKKEKFVGLEQRLANKEHIILATRMND